MIKRIAATICAIGLFALIAGQSNAQTINLSALFHDQGPLYDSAPEPTSTTAVTVKLQCATGNLTAADIVYYDSATSTTYTVAMSYVSHDPTGLYDYWQGTIPASSSEKYYYFEAIDGSSIAYYCAAGASTAATGGNNSFYVIPGYTTPAWMKNGIMYQIIPDRFYNGNTSNDIQTNSYNYEGNEPVLEPWGTTPYPPSGYGNSYVFFGGDLVGIQDKLSYITSTLGANIVYLNPVFQSPTNHKYDTTNYYTVDPCYGGNSALESLITAVHAQSGHVVLDGVFNHTGDSNGWFGEGDFENSTNGIVGAYQSQSSSYYNWYTFYSWPGSYADYSGAGSMPKLDYGTTGSAVREQIYASSTSVAQTYLKAPYSADGWRLDASWMLDAGGNSGADATNHQIWQEFRTAVKGVNPNAVIFGEQWGDPSSWLYDGAELDGATNYIGFTGPVDEWINGVDYNDNANSLNVSGFDSVLLATRAKIPTDCQQVMPNFLGSHDTWRFAQLAGGNIWNTYLALFFQMTYVGTPNIYYGDEYGMMGADDPDCRRTFDWTQATTANSAVALTQKLISIRKQYTALRTGSFMTLLTDDTNNIYAYGRFDASNRIVVVLNNSSSTVSNETVPVAMEGITNGTVLTDAVSGSQFTVSGGSVVVTVEGHYGLILVPGTSSPTVATPTFSPGAGTYGSSQTVTISDATSGATIYYTTNGTTPTTSSTKYTAAVAVSASETIEAIGTAAGDTNSAVGSAAYVIETIPATPASVTATAGNASVALTWTASTGANTYNVYRSTTSGGEGTTALASGITSTSYTDSTVTNGTKYYYKVAAVNLAGTSAQSSEVSATPSGPVEGPYGGTAAAIPGTVYADAYDTGGANLGYDVTSVNGTDNGWRTTGDGVDLEACTDTITNGADVGWSASGQWFRYTVNVATAGTYAVGVRVANGSTTTATFDLQNSAGTNLSGTVSVPPTGGFQTWTTVTATVTLPAGKQVLEVYQQSAQLNLNFMSFSKVGSGSLSGAVTSVTSAQAFNLTTIGTTDWAAWGFDGTDHDTSGGSKIGPLAAYGAGGLNSFTSSFLGMTWTNGTPDASETNETKGYYNNAGIGDGFTFSVPASTITQHVTVYLGGWETSGTLTATLSDGSATTYTNSTLSNSSGSYYAYYVLTYAAASAGQNLTLVWKQASGSGNVTVYSAALH